MQRCEVIGTFIVEVEAKNYRQAKSKAQRILHDSGITGYVTDVNKKEDKHE